MQRRSFVQSLATATIATAALGHPLFAASQGRKSSGRNQPKIKLGLDNFAVRAMGWKAPALIDYAASLKLDTLFISDLDALGSLEDANLRDVKQKADDAGLALYVGSWSICPTSKTFKPTWGTAEEHLRLGLRVARTLGSPVFRVILGSSEDRKTEGGIQARIADMVGVLKKCRREILDSGIKVAVENHSGDMHSWEVLQLVDAAGRDIAGVNIDSGNAAWTLEDPMDVLETLGPVTLCSSLRDDMVWQIPDGAVVQWTAAGDGLIDWKTLAARWSQLCPQVPIMIETISGAQRTFAYKQPDFWKYYDRRPQSLARFEALAQRGRPLTPNRPAQGKPSQDFQRAEFERSINYLRTEIGLGVRT